MMDYITVYTSSPLLCFSTERVDVHLDEVKRTAARFLSMIMCHTMKNCFTRQDSSYKNPEHLLTVVNVPERIVGSVRIKLGEFLLEIFLFFSFFERKKKSLVLGFVSVLWIKIATEWRSVFRSGHLTAITRLPRTSGQIEVMVWSVKSD